MGPRELAERLATQGLGEAQVFESLEMLEHDGHVDCGSRVTTVNSYPGAGIDLVRVLGTTMVDAVRD